MLYPQPGNFESPTVLKHRFYYYSDMARPRHVVLLTVSERTERDRPWGPPGEAPGLVWRQRERGEPQLRTRSVVFLVRNGQGRVSRLGGVRVG